MTELKSKHSAAQKKLIDKLTDESDTLLIVYQRGVADGKEVARRKPLDDVQIDALRLNLEVDIDYLWARKFARAIEAAHNIKDGT